MAKSRQSKGRTMPLFSTLSLSTILSPFTICCVRGGDEHAAARSRVRPDGLWGKNPASRPWRLAPFGPFTKACKRVGDLQSYKASEVAVSRQELRDSMLEAESRNVRVMHEIACGRRLSNG